MNSVSLSTGSLSRWGVMGISLLGGLAIGSVVVAVKPLLFLMLAAALLVPVLISRFPPSALLMLLMSSCLFSFHGAITQSFRTLHVPDLALMLVVGFLVYSVMMRKVRLDYTPLGKPAAFFWASATLSLGWGILSGHVNVMEAIREYKVILFYLLFIPVASFISDSTTLKTFIVYCFAVGVVASVNLLLGAIFKPVALDATDLDVYYGFTELTGGSGLVLVYCCICCCIALAVVHRVVLAGFVATGAYLFFFILKFHRHMYLAIALAILICMALTYSMHRERVLKIISAAILLVFLAGSLIAWGPRVVSRYADLSIKRALSLHGIKSTATVTYRLRENEYAIRMIRANPFIGIGFARPYRPPLYTARNDAMDRFVHNGYLWILLKMGLVGFAAFLWFSGVFIWRGLTRWSTLGDPFFRGVVLGTTVAYLGLCFCNMTSPYFMKDWGVAFIGIMFGINEVAYRCDAQTRLDAALGRAVA